MGDYTVYIDEAGNTGYDIWNTVQPYFVLAGVAVDDRNAETLGNFISREFLSNKTNTEKEFKTKTWLKTTRKRNSLFRMLDKVNELSQGVYVVMMEKRYMAAAKIVDDILDPAYNDALDYSILRDRQVLQGLANYFYDTFDDEILEISRLLQTPTTPNVEKAINLILGQDIDENIRKMVEGAKSHINEWADNSVNKVTNEGLRKNILRSPNYTCFAQLGNMVAKDFKNRKREVSFVFDEASMCDKEFRELYNRFQNIKDSNFLKEIGLESWKDVISSFATAKSHNTPCVQAADLIATSTKNVLMKMDNQVSYNKYDEHVLASVHHHLHEGNLWYIMSNRKLYQLMGRVH